MLSKIVPQDYDNEDGIHYLVSPSEWDMDSNESYEYSHKWQKCVG